MEFNQMHFLAEYELRRQQIAQDVKHYRTGREVKERKQADFVIKVYFKPFSIRLSKHYA